MSNADWEERYRIGGFNDRPAGPLLIETCSNLTPGKAVDLACGAGRHALWLAARGWDVTAVDSSQSAIELLGQRAVSSGQRVHTKVADLEAHEFEIGEACWDLIVDHLYLQRDLFPAIKRGLVSGGIALIAVHLTGTGRPSQYSLQPGELAQYFSGWTVLHSREGELADSESHRLAAELVVRRP
jgi:SAM-dependent methyltransferase